MGTIAQKLEYLNTTKGLIKDTINLTGAGITNDTFRSYASKLKKGYIDIINTGIDTLYNNFPKVSGIGSNLSLTPTYEAPMKLNEIQGNTLQDGTPTPDTPVPIQSVTGNQEIKVTGKNLVDFSNLQTNSNTTYTWQNDILEVKATTGTYNRVYIDITSLYKNNPGKTLRFDYETLDFSQGVSSSVNLQIVKSGTNTYVELVDNSGTIITRTIPNDTSEITQVLLRVVCNNTNTSQASQISITKPILHFGNIATSYEPYKGNTYEVNLGKNLLDYQTTFATPTNSTADNDGWITASYDNTSGSSNAYANYYTKIPDGVKIKPNTTYYVYLEVKNVSYSGASTGNYINVTNVNASYIPQTGISLVRLTDLSNNSIYKYEITTKSDLSGISGLLRTFVGIQAGYSVSLTYRLTLSESNIDVSNFTYSPYFTPIELNKIGDYQDNIKKSTGKNLFDKSTITSGYINADGSITTNNSYVTSDYIPIDSTLSYSKTITNSPRIKLYDKDKNIISNESYSDISSFGNAGTYTIPYTNAKYIRFTIRIDSSGVDINSVMLNEGSTALPYEPYGKVWYVEKQIGKVVLNGTENGWSYNDANAVFIIPDLVDYLRDGFIPYSNLLQGQNISAYNQLSANSISFLRSTTQNRIVIKNTNYTGVTAFKNWLNSNNVTVYYVLATPTYTEITNTELIEDLETLYTAKSQEGTTNISITSEDLEMILNVSALKGEV